jgi:hypothetical protein
VASLITVLLSIFGVLGGAIVYAWQKVVDRHEAQRDELKNLYKDYLTSVQDLSISVPHHDPNEFSTLRMEHRRKFQLIRMLAPMDIVDAAREWESAVLDWQQTCMEKAQGLGDDDLRKKSFAAESHLVDQIRKDLDERSRIKNYFADVVPFVRKPLGKLPPE